MSNGQEGDDSPKESSVTYTDRRTVLRGLSGATVGAGLFVGTLSEEVRAQAQEPSIGISSQTAISDRNDGDDFPVPDSHVVVLDQVSFTQSTGTVALPVKNSDGQKGVSAQDTFWYEGFTKNGNQVPQNAPAVVVGLHSPEVGNGQPDSLSSLIGVRLLAPGEYSEVAVPVWEEPPMWQRGIDGVEPEQFPEEGDVVQVSATIWYGPDVFPPTASRDSDQAIAQTPEDEQNGPVGVGGSLVTSSADVEFGADPSLGINPQVAPPDPADGDDFPVPDDFVVTLPSVDIRGELFPEEDLGTVALPVKNSDGQQGVSAQDTFWYEGFTKNGNDVPANTPAFVLGLHSPEVGNGQPDSLSSLIGVRPLAPGEYSEVRVPIWSGPPKWQRGIDGVEAEQFPDEGDTVEVSATVWYGPDVFPPTADRDTDQAVAQTPEDERNGPVSVSDGLVSSSAFVLFSGAGDNPFLGSDGDPLPESDAADVLFDWNQDREVNGTEYSLSEMADFVFQWNRAQT